MKDVLDLLSYSSFTVAHILPKASHLSYHPHRIARPHEAFLTSQALTNDAHMPSNDLGHGAAGKCVHPDRGPLR